MTWGERLSARLNGYIGYIRRLKTGSEAYGDKYIFATGETPASLEE